MERKEKEETINSWYSERTAGQRKFMPLVSFRRSNIEKKKEEKERKVNNTYQEAPSPRKKQQITTARQIPIQYPNQ